MRRVVKLGGSMLLRADLKHAVDQWMTIEPAAQTFVVVGGGKLIDAIRELDQVHAMDQREIHWTCVDLLTTTATFVAKTLQWNLISTPSQWQAVLMEAPQENTPSVIVPDVFYNRDHLHGNPAEAVRSLLPEDWRTTTDSIAAYLAAIIKADELVLLKSCEIPESMSSVELAESGIVDQAFPDLAGVLAESGLQRFRVEQLV